MTFLDLKQKEVINCKDCKRLGCVADLEIDPCNGQICALIVPAPVRIFSCFGKSIRYCIRFCDVIRIGPDIILVDVCLEDARMRDD
ncbi:MAG: YlmC/YmxH family sporulation protein [Lachnospiraceae bacterium]|nr:YlmC/YmxH family sporulation protein [Lachnospiraceae bacterium]